MARSTVGARIFVDCGFTWNCIARQCLVVRVIAVCDNWHFVQLTENDTRGEQLCICECCSMAGTDQRSV